MGTLDLLAGFFLMNAMPHFVLGIWKGRMLSLFGMSPTANIVYGLLNFVASISLFSWAHGLSGLADHGLYVGALAVLLIYLVTGRFWQRLFAKPRAELGRGVDSTSEDVREPPGLRYVCPVVPDRRSAQTTRVPDPSPPPETDHAPAVALDDLARQAQSSRAAERLDPQHSVGCGWVDPPSEALLEAMRRQAKRGRCAKSKGPR